MKESGGVKKKKEEKKSHRLAWCTPSSHSGSGIRKDYQSVTLITTVSRKAIIISTKPFILHVSVTLRKDSFTNYPRHRELISFSAFSAVRVGPQEALHVNANVDTTGDDLSG